MFVCQPLRREHRTDTFSCGKEELDAWLRRSALHARANNTAATFVWCEEGSTEVVAYYSFTSMTLEREELPRSLARGGMHKMPAVLLARLALDTRHQGRGLGPVLLVDAFERALTGNEVFAVRFFVVDALDEEAYTFYEKHGFRGIPGSMRLYRKMSDIAKTLA
ncbi:GNAT family N-acetyltransferase [Nocardiopsis lambiniae]|uniref:GNAT family N-acetyltransferase n=1 Tax=Nocardiopsis lambiniae TaxID=3075539 RepID=A0ABU2M4R9_9ACTN|nr:GNAT family N-acetyltransferase [Nocardiopsis sp. DSM 44743]MDT0327632.1 GNAT family N-acetyltransferase [Nocardiopsis sp. DSM 44743]